LTRKIITASIVIGAIGLIALVYFTFLSDKKTTGNAFSVIPPDAAFVMQVSNPDQIQPYLAWLTDMASHSVEVVGIEMNPLANWASEIRRLDSLAEVNEQWKSLLGHGYILSSNVTGRADTWCLVIPLLEGNKASPELLSMWLGAQQGEKSFEGKSITSWATKRFTTELHGCLVMSSTPSLAEQLVIDAKKDRQDEQLNEAMALASADMPLHFYARMEGLGWLELDPLFAQESRKLSGYLVLADSVHHPLQLIQGGGDKRIASRLPTNTAMLYAQSTEDYTNTWNNVENYYAGTPSADYWSQSWIAFGDSCACDVNSAVFEWRGNEWGCAIIGDSLFESVAYYAIKDSIRLSKNMFSALVDTFNTDKIFGVRNMELFNRNQTNYLPVEHRFVTQVGDYAFFASNPEVLSKLKQVNDSSSLASSATFRQFRSSMRTTNGLLYYQAAFTPSPFPAVVYYAFGADQLFAANIEPTDGHKCLVSIALTGEAESAVVNNDVAEVPKDTTVASNANERSWPVKNHATGTMDVVTLSAENGLSWITDGKVVWTKPLGETILGDIKQVDLLRNGKLQLLFNTPSKLCAVDKNGNDVAGYPVALPANASGEVSVFDYENNRNYRFVIPLANGAVANLNSEGKPTEGWQYQSAGTAKAMLHLRAGGEDHLLAILANGSVVDCKRNGLVRKNLAISLSDFDGQHLALLPAATLEESTIWYRTTNGTFSAAKLGASSPEIIAGLNALADAAARAAANGASVNRFK
jgi:hypothetical protein